VASVSKSNVIEGIRVAAKKLGRVPNVSELESAGGVRREELRRCFPSLRQAVRAAGLEPTLERTRNRSAVMLEDWAEVARKMGRVPSTKHYDAAGRFSKGTFWLRFGPWNTIPDHFLEYAQAAGTEEKWRDVVKLIEQWKLGAAATSVTAQKSNDGKKKVSGEKALTQKVVANVRRRSVIFADRPVYGAPMQIPGLAYEPVNEMGVVLLFGIMARSLGFHVERVQPDFPDCEAMREMQPGKWQRVRVEFEYESRNFKIHRHPVEKCDVIVSGSITGRSVREGWRWWS